MRFGMNGKFLGCENKTSKKGNTYSVATIMQGSDVLTLMSEYYLDFLFGTDVFCSIEYNPYFKDLKLVDVKLCEAK